MIYIVSKQHNNNYDKKIVLILLVDYMDPKFIRFNSRNILHGKLSSV